MRKRDMRPYRPYGGRRRRPILAALLVVVLLAVILFGAPAVCVQLGAGTRIVGEPRVMVILGCQVKPWGPSTLLQDRLDAALAYLDGHPDMTVVVSGGQGEDEPVSEARCMADYLMAHGYPEERILLEDASRNTWQNLIYSIDLLAEEGFDTTADLMVVSNAWHLTRVRMLYDRLYSSKYLSTLAAPSSHVPTAVRMFFREPLALVKSFLLDRGEAPRMTS